MFIYELLELLATVFGILFFLIVLVVFIIVYGDDIIDAPASLWISAIIMEPVGGLFGYGMGRLAKLSSKDCRTILLETGIQNFSLTIAMITLSFDGDERRQVLLFPLLYGIMYIINGVWIVLVLRYKLAPLDEVDIPEEECNVEETSVKEDQYEMVKESDVEIHS